MRIAKKLSAILLMVAASLSTAVTAFATNSGTTSGNTGNGGIANSIAATGTQNLINDVTSWAMVLAPLVGGACIVYFCIQRSMADPQHKGEWTDRIKTAVVSTIGAFLATSLLSVIVGYYTV